MWVGSWRKSKSTKNEFRTESRTLRAAVEPQPNQPLRLGLHPLNLIWNQPEANLEAMDRAWRSLPPQDVHVFPEMVTTGFLTGLPDLQTVRTDAYGAPYLSRIQDWAREADAVFVLSMVVRLHPEEDRFANRLFAVFPDDRVEYADKMHSFGLAGEDRFFEAGNRPLRFEWRGWRWVAAVCYDLRFPESYRNSWPAGAIRAEYDVLCFVANWPDRRIAHWQALLPARAIENQAVVVGLNRVGADSQGVEHSGRSVVWNASGEPLLELTHNQAVSVSVEVRPEALHELRRKLPFLKDVRVLNSVE